MLFALSQKFLFTLYFTLTATSVPYSNSTAEIASSLPSSETTVPYESEPTTDPITSAKESLLKKLIPQNSNRNDENATFFDYYDFYKFYYPYLKDYNNSKEFPYDYYDINDYYYMYGGGGSSVEEYYKGEGARFQSRSGATEPKTRYESLTLRNAITQNLCFKSQINKTSTDELFLCQNTKLYEFACVSANADVVPCNNLSNSSDLYVPLCVQKELFSYVVACSDPGVRIFCFPDATQQVQLIPCNTQSRRVCFREGSGLEYCSSANPYQSLFRKRRAATDTPFRAMLPSNVHCEECNVDILMEVDEDSTTTPKIEVHLSSRKHKGPESGFK